MKLFQAHRQERQTIKEMRRQHTITQAKQANELLAIAYTMEHELANGGERVAPIIADLHALMNTLDNQLVAH